MRRALLVGIDNYGQSPLSGCVADATRIGELLERNDDGTVNLHCRLLTSPPSSVTRESLRAELRELFRQPADIALFYFSGHGANITSLGGYLVTQDATRNDLGVPMQDVLSLAQNSVVREIVIILDCCDSGAFGQVSVLGDDKIVLRDGVSILTSSGPTESSVEMDGHGLFTSLVCDALAGGASDVRGEVNAASVYSYCDQTLGPWNQRPRFLANVSRLTELRLCRPQVDEQTLRLLTVYFPSLDYDFKLDPSFEPDKKGLPSDTEVNEQHEEIFSNLQKYRAARLLEPIGAEHMYFAAINSKSCRLTPLGKFYWNLVQTQQI